MLYRAVDEVLHYIWDPIGISGVPEARDEYHPYLPHVYDLVRNGADTTEVANYLSSITTERMGLTANASHDLQIANVLLCWKAVCIQTA